MEGKRPCMQQGDASASKVQEEAQGESHCNNYAIKCQESVVAGALLNGF